MSGEPRKPFWVKCSACQHIWAAAYAPMEASKFAKAINSCCPNCAQGPKGIFIAKQKDGVLNEPLAPHQTGANA